MYTTLLKERSLLRVLHRCGTNQTAGTDDHAVLKRLAGLFQNRRGDFGRVGTIRSSNDTAKGVIRAAENDGVALNDVLLRNTHVTRISLSSVRFRFPYSPVQNTQDTTSHTSRLPRSPLWSTDEFNRVLKRRIPKYRTEYWS